MHWNTNGITDFAIKTLSISHVLYQHNSNIALVQSITHLELNHDQNLREKTIYLYLTSKHVLQRTATYD